MGCIAPGFLLGFTEQKHQRLPPCRVLQANWTARHRSQIPEGSALHAASLPSVLVIFPPLLTQTWGKAACCFQPLDSVLSYVLFSNPACASVYGLFIQLHLNDLNLSVSQLGSQLSMVAGTQHAMMRKLEISNTRKYKNKSDILGEETKKEKKLLRLEEKRRQQRSSSHVGAGSYAETRLLWMVSHLHHRVCRDPRKM